MKVNSTAYVSYGTLLINYRRKEARIRLLLDEGMLYFIVNNYYKINEEIKSLLSLAKYKLTDKWSQRTF